MPEYSIRGSRHRRKFPHHLWKTARFCTFEALFPPYTQKDFEKAEKQEKQKLKKEKSPQKSP
jgi:hypothetical protein